MSAEGQTYYTS